MGRAVGADAMTCPRSEAELATIRRMYKHLDKPWRKRFRREHWCPECNPTPAHPPLPRDPEETR